MNSAIAPITRQGSSLVSRMLGTSNKKDAVDDIGGILRSGYLVKLATKSKMNWKKRFFILHENNLKYFSDHLSTTGPCKGEFHITENTLLSELDRNIGKDFCLQLKNADEEELVISARDVNDKRAWKDAIETAIHRTKNSTRGYALTLDKFNDKPVRKYFILHDRVLTYHQDEDRTGAIQGMVELNEHTKVQISEEMYALSLTDTDKNRIILQFDSSTNDFQKWKSSILAVTGRAQARASQTDEVRIKKAHASALKEGLLQVRPPSRSGEQWEERYFILTSSDLYQLLRGPDESYQGGRIVETYRIHPSCSVFETNLGPFAFELVTSEKVLHVMGESKEVTNGWITALRDTIFHSQPEPDDPLVQAAMKKIDQDNFYNVTFREDKPLGVVLERTGEWAVVKLSNFKDTGVYIGSALTSVNDVDVTLFTYAATIEQLRNWRPPLKLGFRKAPCRHGYLFKQARSSNRSGIKKTWTQRYFSLDEGRLMYKESDSSDVTLKGDFPLMGSAVSLVSEEETGRPYCFRLVSGVTCLIMHASSHDEMMDWAATLYHAIAIANGGAYLIAIEREKRRKAEIDEAQRLKEEEEAREAARQAEELAKELAEREEAERLRQEEERQQLEEASQKLTAAMEQRDVDALAAAIEVMDNLALPDAPLLADAKALYQALLDEKNTQVMTLELAEKELDAGVDIINSKKPKLSQLSAEELDVVSHAIENAKRAGVDGVKIEDAMNLMMSTRHHRQRREELIRSLKFAMMYKSVAGLREAISAIDEEGFADDDIPDLEEGRQMLKELEDELAQAKAEEDERLAKEAAELDAQLNSVDISSEGKEDNEKDGDSDDDVAPLPSNTNSFRRGPGKGANQPPAPPAEKVKIIRQPSNKYTIAAAAQAKQQSSRFVLGQEADDDDESDQLPSLDSVRDEDIGKVFEAFARRSSTGTINPMQFSTIWRMLTGDKGNLFQEMQLFHKFDIHNNGALAAEDFIAGWRMVASQPGGERLLRKIKTLTKEDNVFL